MDALIGFDDLLPYGEVKGNVLQIRDSFAIEKKSGIAKCMVLTALTSYEGEKAPLIRFSITVNGQEKALYESHIYTVGKKKEYTSQSWRVPPMFLRNMKFAMSVEIPEGTVLTICSFSSCYDTPTNYWDGGLRHNAHLGFIAYAPSNTMPAFELAAACGFPACIVCPKVTADGVFVCIHDKTINLTARDENGNKAEEPIYVAESTYEELQKWEYGSFENEIYKGAKLPLLEDFFKLCAKTGMRPMFSSHLRFTEEQWQQIKNMINKYGLLSNLHIKAAHLDKLQTAYSVFGTEIEGYTLDVMFTGWEDDIVDQMLNSGIDISKSRVGIEVRFDDYTEDIAKKIIDAGMFAAAWNIRHRTADEYRRLISYGVTEFTEDVHCSMGLNW